MPRLLLLGATGYIGQNLIDTLTRNGQHTIYAVARTPKKANTLARQEIRPILCPDPVNDPSPYLEVIRSARIDVVVDVSGAGTGSYRFLDEMRKVGIERLERFREVGVVGKGPKLGFVYCSGTWVHGSSKNEVTDLDVVGVDISPNTNNVPVQTAAWRSDLEHAVLNSVDILDVVIIRPAQVYGRECPDWKPFFKPLLDARRNSTTSSAGTSIQIPLDPHSRPALIHVDDVASGLHCAIDRLPLISGTGVYPVFDLCTTQESMRSIFDELKCVWGLNCEVVLSGHGGGLIPQAMSATMYGSSARAKQILGWEPGKMDGFVRNMALYALSFEAALEWMFLLYFRYIVGFNLELRIP